MSNRVIIPLSDVAAEGSNLEAVANFNVIDDNEELIKDINPVRKNVSCFGIVVHMTKSFYSDDDPSVNFSLHIPVTAAEVMVSLKKELLDKYSLVVKNIVIGHEHGGRHSKCHYQCCVFLATKTNIRILPGQFTIGGNTLIYIAQKAKNSHALLTYCQKDGDITYLNEDLKFELVQVEKKDGTKVVKPYHTIANNRDKLTFEEAMEIVLKYDPMRGISQYRNVEYGLKNLCQPYLPEFKWTLPDHIKGVYPNTIDYWFYKYCVPDNMDRRKALVLYSEDRGLGKTRFALSLVPHPDYVFHFRGTFSADDFTNKTPKLLLLDDMSHYNSQNKETWKALLVSQPTSIRDCYVNKKFDFRIPTIVCTNDLGLVTSLMSSKEFNDSIIVQEITDYMGPPGTQPEEIRDKRFCVSDKVLKALDEKKKRHLEFAEHKRQQFQVVPDNMLGRKLAAPFEDSLVVAFKKQKTEIEELKSELKKKDEQILSLKESVDKMVELINSKFV